ncbi:radical SAM/SPASM domain-containing protein [Brachyspira alvinipulli]|uniref:radical SAM/SPASM domain-containing protein n=1 Tax=Brachyspira alvinipulli TaxID=84379 RepID=UPI00048734BF|nr:radical SAM/SPASM domain-containing protein [Brachyspira alvinipulli]
MAKEVNWIEYRGRVYLKDVLPLDTPFKIEIEPTSACNFKCIYCRHSAVNIKPEFMTMETFDKIIEGAKKFPKKIKTFNFVGIGEPLLNKYIYEMIPKANEIANDTVLVTNGSLLTEENSNKLIKSGIKTIRVSLQGINSEDYYKTCAYKINFKKFLNNIKYLYENKPDTMKLFLKMPDIAINTEVKKKIFYELFEDKCDYLTIQNIGNLYNNIDYSNIIINKNSKSNSLLVCPQPFYFILINVNGYVYPCCHAYDDFYIGNIYEQSLVNIWNGEKLKKLRIEHLNGNRNKIPICKNCDILNYFYNEYDDIDNYTEELLKKYE